MFNWEYKSGNDCCAEQYNTDPDEYTTYVILIENGKYMPFITNDFRIGGYIGKTNNIVRGFAKTIENGYHPDNICASLDEAKERCENYERIREK